MEEELLGIIEAMEQAGESAESIAEVVQAYETPKGKPEPVEAKGDTAEVENSGASQSSSAVESSSLEYNRDINLSKKESKGVTDFIESLDSAPNVSINSIINPELEKERLELKSIIDSRPLMANNSKEESRLKEIESIYSEMSAPKKSDKKRADEAIEVLNNQQLELEKKADQLSKNSSFSFEEILKNDGTYQDIIKQKTLQESNKALDEQVLLKVKEDTNSNLGVKDLFTNVGRMFGIKDSAEQIVKLSNEVEEEILSNLDNVTKEKLAQGQMSLEEKESLISSAKSAVINKNYDNYSKQQNDINNSNLEDSDKLNQINDLKFKFNEFLGQVGYDVAGNILNDTFTKTTDKKTFDESVVKGGFLPKVLTPLSTILDEGSKLVLKGTAGLGTVFSMVGDSFQSDDHYSVFDAFGDVTTQLTEQSFTPNTKSKNFRIRQDNGELNLGVSNVLNDVAKSIPFTIGIALEARKGKMGSIESALGQFINPTKNDKFSGQLKMMESAYKLTLSDNYKEAKRLGLEGIGAAAYTNVLSLVEGITEPIMDDTKFFKTVAGDAILKSFKGDLKSSTTKKVVGESVKRFVKNVAAEIGEEEIVLAVQDLTKFALVAGHKNSEFWDIRNQAELAVVAGSMSGAMTSLGARSNIIADKASIYKDISNNINGVVDQLNIEKNSAPTVSVSQELSDTIEWANNLNLAVKSAPTSVTGEQIDLLMEKSNLLTEMKSVDDAFHPQYKAKIEVINNKINPLNEKDTAKSAEENTTEPLKQTTPDNTKAEGTTKQGGTQAEDTEKVSDTVTPEQKTAYQNTAKAIRSAKIYKTPSEALNKLSSNPVGLLAVAWDGALETVATTVELTGNLDAAIRKGVVQIKQSEWYKSLSAEGKKEALGILEKDLRANLTPLAESVVPKSKQTVKTTVRKTTGQVDESKTFTISEAKLLKDKFKNLAKGSALGAKSVMEGKRGFIKDISSQLKSLINSKTLTAAEAARVLSAVNQFNEKNIDKVQPLVDKVVNAIEKRGLTRSIKTVKSKLKKASSSDRNPVNIKDLAKSAISINEKYLDAASQKRYEKLLNKLSKAIETPTSKNYEMVAEDAIYSELNDLNKLAEDLRLKELAASMGLDGQSLTESELNTIWESSNVDDYIKTLGDDKAKAARLALEKQAGYVTIGLNDVDGTNLSEQERKDVKELKNVDLTLLSSTDIRDLIKVVDNIILNGNFSSSGEIVSKVRAYTASKESVDSYSKEDLSAIKSSTLTDLSSLSLIFKKVFMSSQKSATFNRLSGLTKLGLKMVDYKNEFKGLSDRYTEAFDKAKGKSKFVRTPEATMLRGVVGQLIQGKTKEDFEINKSRLEDDIKNKKQNQFESNRRVAQKEEIQYERVKHLGSQQEVVDYIKSLNDGNWDLIEFWIDFYKSKREALRYNTEVVHGKSFEEVEGYYLPIKMKGSAQHSKDIDNESFFSANGIPNVNPSTTTISRTKSKTLPKDRMLDLDFDSVMFNKAGAVLIDIHTSSAYKDVYHFFRSPNMKKMFGLETLEVFTKKMREMRQVQLGISSMNVSEDEVAKAAIKVERIWKGLAVTTALAGLTAYPKQYLSVVPNVAFNLGKHSGLMFKAMFTDKSNIPLLDKVSITFREDTQGGTVTASTRVSEAEKKATKAAVDRLAQETGLAVEEVRNALFFPLRRADVNVAKSSWLAFYQASLLDQGVDINDIDMSTEHERMDDVRRQQAISYAEIKVEETQIASDESRGSEFYQSKSAYKAFLRSMFLPFQSFNINSKVRMLTDLRIIGNKRATKKQKLEAGRSLIGTATEIITFQTVKYYALAPLIGLGKDAIMDLFDLDSPDEDEGQKSKFTFKQWYSALSKDLNPLTIGAFAEDMSIEILNFLQYLQDGDSDEEYIDYIKRKGKDGEGQLFYRYKDKSERNNGFGASVLSGGGLYAIPMTQYGEMSEAFNLMYDGTRRDDYGNLNRYDFNDNEKTFLKIAFALELVSMFGLGEADTRRVFTKIRRDLVKNTSKTKIN